MTAVIACARAELRARFPSMLALALLLGLGTGALLMLTPGALRTDSTFDFGAAVIRFSR